MFEFNLVFAPANSNQCFINTVFHFVNAMFDTIETIVSPLECCSNIKYIQ